MLPGHTPAFQFRGLDEMVLKKLECREMSFTAIDPKTGKAKDYNNSAEFFKEVDEARAKEPEKPREVKTYAEASRRLREEAGIDLRDPAERQQAENNEFIEQRIAAGVAEALERQQAAQKAEKAQQAAQTAKATNQATFSFTVSHAPRQPKYNFRIKPECGRKAGAHASEAVHVSHGRGPVMQQSFVRV